MVTTSTSTTIARRGSPATSTRFDPRATGNWVYWTKDFTDILDWQADVARFDLHSVGTTVVDPRWSESRFVDRSRDDYRLFDPVAGQRFTSPSIDAGDPLTDLALPSSYENLLANPDFNAGLANWDVHPEAATRAASPAPFAGSEYYFAGTAATGYAEQTIDLVAAGFDPSGTGNTGSVRDVRREASFGRRIAARPRSDYTHVSQCCRR